jgi:hypothetical protein
MQRLDLREGNLTDWLREQPYRGDTEGCFYVLALTDRCFKIGITTSLAQNAGAREDAHNKSNQDIYSKIVEVDHKRKSVYSAIWEAGETPDVVLQSYGDAWETLTSTTRPTQNVEIWGAFQLAYRAFQGDSTELTEDGELYELRNIQLKLPATTKRYRWWPLDGRVQSNARDVNIEKPNGKLASRIRELEKKKGNFEGAYLKLCNGTLCRLYAMQLAELSSASAYSKCLYCFDWNGMRVIDSDKAALKKLAQEKGLNVKELEIKHSMQLPLQKFELKTEGDQDTMDKHFWLACMPEKGVVPTEARRAQLCYYWFLDTSILTRVEQYSKEALRNLTAEHFGFKMTGQEEIVIGLTFTQLRDVVRGCIEWCIDNPGRRPVGRFPAAYSYADMDLGRQFPWFAELHGGEVQLPQLPLKGVLSVNWYVQAVQWADTYTLRQWLEMGWIGQKGHTCAQDPWRGLVDAFQFKLRF